MNSMTGYGHAELKTKLGRFIVEISSVNSRFLDYYIKLPRQLYSLEIKIKELVAEKISRGKVNINVELEESESVPGKYTINEKAVREYYRQLLSLKKSLKLAGELTIRDLLLLPDVAEPELLTYDLDGIWKKLQKVIQKAIGEMIVMREQEGRALASEMKVRLAQMDRTAAEIEKKSANAVDVYREKLTRRIKELLDTPLADANRLEEEVILFADRTDITEELTRLRIHIEQFGKTLKQKEQIGKKLNFILQEMNRETNTIGAKCSEFSISSQVIHLKEEIEKLREQVQNIE
ncbi:MAG: YicC family protein [candidate division Zixibacteria bacterium]|nr:YicC family protein [candidate division Zixibacteria bacterium]